MVSGVAISRILLDELLALAAASPGVEVCGLLFGGAARIDAAQAAENVADDPSRRFEIDPGALIAAHRQQRLGGPMLIGHYHSHPSGKAEASPRDAAQAMGDGALWLVLADGEAGLWRSDAPGRLTGVPLEVTVAP